MQTYISLLRAINLGSKNKINMKELQSLYESMGFKDVKTFINSGNVVFKANQAKEEKIEAAIKKRFGLTIKVMNRTGQEFKKVMETNPFRKQNPKSLSVLFLSAIPKDYAKDALNKAKSSKEAYAIIGREAYLFLPNGFGRSKLASAFTEKNLNVAATARNWNTVTKLYELSLS